MSKNSGQRFDLKVVKYARMIREKWKNQFTKNKIRKPKARLEIQEKIQKERIEEQVKEDSTNKMKIIEENPNEKIDKVLNKQKHNFVLGESSNLGIEVEDDGTIYKNEYVQYYENLENNNRKNCFKMLVKIFDELKDIISRVFRDRISLKQKAFSDQMGFSFSNYFHKLHKDHFLVKNKM